MQVQIATTAQPQQQAQQQAATTVTAAPSAVTVQADTQQPITFTGANGQQYTVIPANLQQLRGTNLGSVIQMPNIQAIPTIQNIPGKCLMRAMARN